MCTLDKLEVDPSRPMLADFGAGISGGIPLCIKFGIKSGAGRPARGDSIVGELSGIGVKGWLRGNLSIASIVSYYANDNAATAGREEAIHRSHNDLLSV